MTLLMSNEMRKGAAGRASGASNSPTVSLR